MGCQESVSLLWHFGSFYSLYYDEHHCDFDKFSSINVEESIANFFVRGVLNYIGTSDLRYVRIICTEFYPCCCVLFLWLTYNWRQLLYCEFFDNLFRFLYQSLETVTFMTCICYLELLIRLKCVWFLLFHISTIMFDGWRWWETKDI